MPFKDPAERAAYQTRWRALHRGRVAEIQATYYHKHKEAIQARILEYTAKRPEIAAKCQHNYRSGHKAEIATYQRAYSSGRGRELRLGRIAGLSDGYVVSVLFRRARPAAIPRPLVEAKRAHIMCVRALRRKTK